MKKQYFIIAILLFLLLVLPLLLILVKKRAEIRPKAAFGTVNLALTPSTLTKNVGEIFEVEVQIIQPQAATATPTPITLTPTPTITPGGPTLTPTPTSGAPTPTPTSGQPTPTPTPHPPTSTPTPVDANCAATCQAQSLPGGTCKRNSQGDEGDVCIGDRLAFGCRWSPNYYCCCEGNVCQAACQQLGHSGGACKTPYNPLFPACETSETNIGPFGCREGSGGTCCCSGDGPPPAHNCAAYCQASFLQGGTCKHEWEIDTNDSCTTGGQYGCGGQYCCCQKPTCSSACQQLGYSSGGCMSSWDPFQTCQGQTIGQANCNEFEYCCCTNEQSYFPNSKPQGLLKTAHAQAQTGAYKISAVDLTLSFDKDILKVTDVALGNGFTDFVLKEIKNDQDLVRFSVVSKKPTDQLPSGTVIPVAKITFQAKAPGTSAVSFAQHQIVGYNAQNEDVSLSVDQKPSGSYTIVGEALTPTPTPTLSPTPTPTITPTVTPTTTPIPTGTPTPTIDISVPRIKFFLKFRGMGAAAPDLTLTRLRVIDEKQINEPHSDFTNISVTSLAGRVYQTPAWVVLKNLTAGTNFTLLVKGPKHLQKRMARRIQLFEGGDERNIFNWTDEQNHLDPGDLPPQDGVCNGHDASRLLNVIGSTKQPDLQTADLNYDGIVNLNDYSLLLNTLSERYEDEE